MPQIVILAGPNGAGKTTASAELLRDRLRLIEFVNADAIAAGLSPFAPERVALEAGRLMLGRMNRLAAARTDFAFETTLAARTYRPWLVERLEEGYEVELLFFWLPTPQLALERVATRVRLGGHDIPDQTVRQRYKRGLINFFHLYRAIVSRWSLFNSAAGGHPVLIAEGGENIGTTVHDRSAWDTITATYDAAKNVTQPRTSDPDLPRRLRDRALIDAGLRAGVQAALRRHKQAGVPIAVWQDGKVVLIPADRIQVDDNTPGKNGDEASIVAAITGG